MTQSHGSMTFSSLETNMDSRVTEELAEEDASGATGKVHGGKRPFAAQGNGRFLLTGGEMFYRTDKKQIGASDTARSGHVVRLGMTERVLKGLFAAAIWLFCAGAAHGLIIIDNSMKTTDPGNWTMGGAPNPAILTGDGAIDPGGDGWLRITNATVKQTGFAYNSQVFDLSNGLIIQFEYSTWGGNGADGYSVFLFDANAAPFNIGAFGGSLGYAQKLSTAACNPVTPSVPGISGGYIGIGVDEFGNFAYGCEGRSGGASQRANTVTIRGPVVGFGIGAVGQTSNAASYPWIATSANNGSLWYNGTPRPSQAGINYRKVIVKITPAPNPTADIWIQFGYNTIPVQMLTGVILPAITKTQLLKIGYGASTGDSTNYHEIRNLLLTDQNTATARDLGISKTALNSVSGLPITDITIGAPIRYVITARDYGPFTGTASSIPISDVLPAEITGTSWSCVASVGASCGTVPGAGSGTLNTTINLPVNGSVTYTVDGTMTANPTGNTLNNTATLNTTSFSDYNPANDTASAPVNVVKNIDLGITNTPSVTSMVVGNPITYTVVASNNGASNVTVYNARITDTVPAQLTGVTWACTGAGGATCGTASCNSNCNVIDTLATIPLNGTATYTISGTLSSSVAGNQLSNIATVAPPAGMTDSNSANNSATATFTVAVSVAGTGTKLLYLHDTTTLSRTQPPVIAFTSINDDATASWAMTPGAAGPIKLSPTVSANIPVTIYLRRNKNNGARDVTATLLCTAPGSTPISQMRTLNLTGTVTSYNFTLPPTGSFTAQTCAPPYTWNLKVSVANSQANNNDGILVYTSNGANPSHVDLPVTTVINVDSISLYNADYPGGSAITSVTTSSTVYIRAVVSDPFGSYDIITAPTITIKDPSNNTLVNTASMSLVATGAESPSLTKTYQYQYPVPASPAGNWSISVKATEGTETTPAITNTGYAAMPVVTPPASLTVLKYAFGVTSGASAKPGREIPYMITVSNTGPGIAGNMVVQDCLSPYSAWTLNTFTFADGVAPSGPSGLSLTGSTMYYSYDNGITWTTTPPTDDGTGHAPAVNCWKLVMDPAKSMNANPSSFNLNYQSKVK